MSPVAAPATDLSTGRRWSKAQDLFEQALDQPEAEREAYVRASAQNDPWLLQSVLELLVLDEGSSPLDRSPPRRGEAREPASEASVGDLIGKYRLLEPIGAGGMGCVYRAERVDGSIRQEVAVKILRTTHLRPQDRQRFLQEQRIMAGLRHARIAQLLDYGSTPKGAAYLVMTLVQGTSITHYADDHHLPIAERIRLFLTVCDAVHHAHRRLVVHRDLKPANILVGADGEPLLLDFGIAKVLDPAEHLDGMATRTELRVMTPSYASPEQLLGQPITTGTDVWALGVLLFELLTGRRPFDWTGMPLVEIERHLELDPKPKASAAIPAHRADAQRIALRRGLEPGRLRRRLRGDLDLIIGRALAYRSDERYGSVEALTLDLERYLAGRPVHARRPSLVYRTSKFLRRHALVVAGVAIGVAVLIGFLLLQAAQSQRLKTERDAARQERDKAQLMSELLADVLDLADPSNRKLNQAAQSMLELGKQRILRDFGQQPAAQADLLTRVGTLYRRTGAYEEAEALLDQAADIWQQTDVADPLGMARTLDSLGFLYHQKRDPRAVETLRKALRLFWQVHGGDHLDVARAMMHLGAVLRYQGEARRAEALLRLALAMDGRLGTETTAEAGARLADLASLIGRQGRRQEALELFDRALDIGRATRGEHSVTVAVILNRKATLFYERPLANEGARLLRQATEIFRDLLGEDHPLVATGLNNLAAFYSLLGDLGQAESFQRQAWACDQRRLGDEHPSTLDDRRGLAMILRESGRLAEAEEHLRQSVAVLARLKPADHPALLAQRNDLARVLLDLGLLDAAAEQLDKALAAIGPGLEQAPARVGRTYLGLAELALLRRDFQTAHRHAAEAVQRLAQQGTATERWRLAEARSALGSSLVALGCHGEGVHHLRAAYEALLELRGDSIATRQAKDRWQGAAATLSRAADTPIDLSRQ